MLQLQKNGKINNGNKRNADLNVRERKEIPLSIFCCFKFEKANFHKLKEKNENKGNASLSGGCSLEI